MFEPYPSPAPTPPRRAASGWLAVNVVAAWAGVLVGVALGWPEAAPPAVVDTRPLGAPTLPARITPAAPAGSDGVAHPELEGLRFRGWHGIDSDAEPPPDAALRWALLADGAGRRVTMVRFSRDALEAALMPSAANALERPELSAAVKVDAERVAAVLDLGVPAGAMLDGHLVGVLHRAAPMLAIEGGYVRLAADASDVPSWSHVAQGRAPESGEPFAGVAILADGYALWVHAVGVGPDAISALLARLGARRIVLHAGVDALRPGHLYTRRSERTGTWQLSRRALVPGSGFEAVPSLKLDNVRLVLHHRPPGFVPDRTATVER